MALDWSDRVLGVTYPRGVNGAGNKYVWRVAVWSVLGLMAVGLALVPLLPGGPDVYAHLLWAHQSLRCLATGTLPVWAPDLNAGFGSPGIRLYSPAGPCLAGLLGLPFDDACAGLRLTLVPMVIGVWLVARHLRVGWAGVGLVLLSPFLLGDLFVRAAWSQVLAVPLAWWILEEAASGDRFASSWRIAGVSLAGLWLIHAPTAVMAAPVAVSCVLARFRWRRSAWRWAAAVVAAAAALTAWHWLALVSELDLVSAHMGLTEGIFSFERNYLGSPTAHATPLNQAYSLAALALLLVILVLHGWRRSEDRWRWVLVLACLALATCLVVPLIRAGLPLGWLQFPWRWLWPAALLLVSPIAGRLRRGDAAAVALVVVWIAPLAFMPWQKVVSVDTVGGHDGWIELGKVARALGGNPLAVDVVEHRPPCYEGLGDELRLFGVDGHVVATAGAGVRVDTWRPLRRRVIVEAPNDARVRLRLMRYPWWRLSVDGVSAFGGHRGTAVSVAVPAGRHAVDVRWEGNPLTPVGIVVALIASALVLWRRRPPPPDVEVRRVA